MERKILLFRFGSQTGIITENLFEKCHLNIILIVPVVFDVY
jgi:hypothetical protein